MRRLLSVVIATLLAALLLAPATAAFADVAPADDGAVTVLAAEGGEQGPLGPEPRGPNDTENSNAPSEYEPPFLINAAVGLTALLVVTVLGLGGLYWLLVQRHRTSSNA